MKFNLRNTLLIFVFCSCLSCSKDEDTAFMEEVRNIYNASICKSPYYVQGYFAEYAKYNNRYLAFTDGLGYVLGYGYDYEIPKDNFSFIPYNLRKSNRDIKWISYLRNLYKEAPVVEQSDIPPGCHSLFNTFRFFEEQGPLHEDFLDKYQYATPRVQDNYTCIDFKPDSAKKEQGRYYQGTIFIHSKTLQIQKIELVNSDFYSEPFRKLVKAKVSLRYKHEASTLYLESIETDIEHENLSHHIILQCFGTIKKNIHLTDAECRYLFNQDFAPFVFYDPKDSSIEKFKIKSVYEGVQKSITPPSLYSQFLSNSNKPYSITKLTDGQIDSMSNKMLSEKILNKLNSH